MPLIILDRDGVINQDSDDYIKSVQEFVPLPGSLQAIARLNAAGYRVAVATNQSGIGRGLFDLDTFKAMHAKLDAELAELGGHIDVLAFCPHAPEEDCDCRKPKTGLLRQIVQQLGLDISDLTGVSVIGDSLRDLQSAQAVGATPMLVRTGKGERTLPKLAEAGLAEVPVFDDLAAAVDALLA